MSIYDEATVVEDCVTVWGISFAIEVTLGEEPTRNHPGSASEMDLQASGCSWKDWSEFQTQCSDLDDEERKRLWPPKCPVDNEDLDELHARQIASFLSIEIEDAVRATHP